jgi:hypothetical protein
MVAIASYSFKRARYRPRQIRGPAPNGIEIRLAEFADMGIANAI